MIKKLENCIKHKVLIFLKNNTIITIEYLKDIKIEWDLLTLIDLKLDWSKIMLSKEVYVYSKDILSIIKFIKDKKKEMCNVIDSDNFNDLK